LQSQASGARAASGGALIENAVYGLDRWLRRRSGVYEYSVHPACLYRINRGEADARLILSDGTRIASGDPVLNLHLWNEHVPPMSSGDCTLAWARRMARSAVFSLTQLAQWLAVRPEHDDIVALRADMCIATSAQCPQLTRIALHMGFEPVRAPGLSRDSGYLRQLGENFFMLLLVMAANPAALRSDVLWRDRALFYLSRTSLERRYGQAPGRDLVHGIS
jgi:YkoP domain